MITPMALESSITLEIGRPMTDEPLHEARVRSPDSIELLGYNPFISCVASRR